MRPEPRVRGWGWGWTGTASQAVFGNGSGEDREARTLLCAFELAVTPRKRCPPGSRRAAPRSLRGTRPWAHLTPRRLKSHLARGQAPRRYAEPATPASVTPLRGLLRPGAAMAAAALMDMAQVSGWASGPQLLSPSSSRTRSRGIKDGHCSTT